MDDTTKILKTMKKVDRKYEDTPEKCRVRRARLMKKYLSLCRILGI